MIEPFDHSSPNDVRAKGYEDFHNALIGALNGAALTTALLTGAAVLVRKPDILWDSPWLTMIEVAALVLFAIYTGLLTLWVLGQRLDDLPDGKVKKTLTKLFLVAVFGPLMIALSQPLSIMQEHRLLMGFLSMSPWEDQTVTDKQELLSAAMQRRRPAYTELIPIMLALCMCLLGSFPTPSFAQDVNAPGKDLGHGFRDVIRFVKAPSNPLGEAAARYRYLYYKDIKLGQTASYSIAPSGNYSVLQDDPTGDLLFFSTSTQKVTLIEHFLGSKASSFVWLEDRKQLTITFEGGRTSSFDFANK